MNDTLAHLATELTDAQHTKLDRLDKDNPGAKVVGWFMGGPVIRYPSGQERNVRRDGKTATCKGWDKYKGATK
jgi:hypothetical protein